MSKKLLSFGAVVVLVAAVLVGAGASTVNAQSVSCANIDSFLMVLGITDPVKVAQAKAAFGCSSSVSSSCYSFTKDLTVGSTGADVSALQAKVGVSPATGYFGPITLAAVKAYQTANLITPAAGYVGPITRAKLSACAPVTTTTTTTTTTTSNTSTLSGGAGDLDLTETSTDVEDTVKEGESDVNVLGIKAEADGSDIEITSVKVTLKNASSTDDTSEKLSDYLDEVSIFLDSEQVGSADVSDFSKDSGTPDEFSKTISLKGAIIKDNDDAKLYVAVSGASNIDSEDLDAELNVEVNTLRFVDGTGAILSGDVDAIDDLDFGFDDASTDDQIDMKLSSSNPDDDTVKVDENSTSDDYLDLVFKLDVDEDSSDIMITSIPVVITIDDAGAGTDSVEDVIDTVTVTIDGEDFEADLDTDSVENGSGTATYVVDFNDDEVTIDSGDVVDVKVSLTFNEQDGNYDEDTTVVASVDNDDVDAETEDDDIDVGGSTKTGATLTLTLSGATVEVTDTAHSQNDSGTLGSFTFEVTISAEDADVEVDAASILETVLGGSDTSYTSITIVNTDGDATENGANDYTVADGDTNDFSITYTHDPDSAGTYYVRLDSIDGVNVDELAGPETLSAS